MSSAGACFSPQRKAGSDLAICHKSHLSHPSLSTFKVLLSRLSSLPPAFTCQHCMMLSSTTFSQCNFSHYFPSYFAPFPSPDQILHSVSPKLPILPSPHSTHLSSRSSAIPQNSTQSDTTLSKSSSISLCPHPHGTLLHDSSATPPWSTHALPLTPTPTTTVPPGLSLCPPTHPQGLTPRSSTPPSRLCPASPGRCFALRAVGRRKDAHKLHTWLEQIPRWLHSFPCILFSLPDPRGHFPFPLAFPLPAGLISLSWPCSPTPRRSRPTGAPSRWPRAPPGHPSLPALTAWSLHSAARTSLCLPAV